MTRKLSMDTLGKQQQLLAALEPFKDTATRRYRGQSSNQNSSKAPQANTTNSTCLKQVLDRQSKLQQILQQQIDSSCQDNTPTHWRTSLNRGTVYQQPPPLSIIANNSPNIAKKTLSCSPDGEATASYADQTLSHILIQSQTSSTNNNTTGTAPYPKAQAPDTRIDSPSQMQLKLAQDLGVHGVSNHRFVQCPKDYYDRPLEQRAALVQAASERHMCKTIVMENTRITEEEAREQDLVIGKYFMVIVQYVAKLQSQKLQVFIHRTNNGALSRKKINPRLVSDDVSARLTEYGHNAVAPLLSATPVPIILSHEIAQLQPGFFFVGGGEVDLKLGMDVQQFIDGYKPFVVECT